MDIHLASDLHLDIYGLLPDNVLSRRDGILLLAGDTCEANSFNIKNRYGVTPLDDLKRICNAFDFVYAIPGNHEYYNSSTLTAEDIIRDITKDIPNFKLLQEEVVDLTPSTQLIAATLWTNINQGNVEDKLIGMMQMNDYNTIRTSDGPYENSILHPDDTEELHKKHLKFILDELERTSNCIVMTHHAPLMSHANINRNRGRVKHFYASDLSTIIENNTDRIAYWAHGHSHEARQTMMEDTIVLTHARGYCPGPLELAEFEID